jgi:tetratricopeptide (TPR) repeat protein
MKQKIWIAFLGLLIWVTLIYSNHFHNSFHFDDSHTIQNNLYIQHIGNIPLFFKDGRTFSSLPSNQSYRPILSTTLAIDYWLGKGLSDTFQFHLTSFILFLFVGLFAFLMYKKIAQETIENNRVAWVALIAVAIYMVHPVSAETVNYIIQRGDILATFFTLLGFVLYLYVPFAKRTFLYLLPVFIGVLAKPNALVFAPILACYVMLFEQKTDFDAVFNTKTLFQIIKKSLPAFLVCIAAYGVMSALQSKDFVPGGTNTFLYIITQPYMIAYYVSAFFAPVHLTADTDWTLFESVFQAETLFGFGVLLLLLGVIYFTAKNQKTRPIAFGLLWFLIANLPTSLLPFAEVMNDHRMFLPFVGLALAVVWAFYLMIDLLAQNVNLTPALRFFGLGILLFILVSFSYATRVRNEVWKTEESLWKDCAEKSPKNGRGLMNYGLALMARADYKNAEIYFQRGLESWPYYAYLHVNMGILKNAMGKADEAEPYFKNGIAYGVKYPNSYFYYARFLIEKNRKEEAVIQLKKCLEIANSLPDARVVLMNTLFELGRLEELRQVAQETLTILPDNTIAKQYLEMAKNGKSKLEVTKENALKTNTAGDFLELSLQYYQAGQYRECIEAGQQALKIDPKFAAAYNNIGSAYNMLGDFEEGKKALEQAVSLDPNSQLAKNNLAWAEAELKKK